MSEINLFGSLRDLSKKGTGDRWGIRVTAPELTIDPAAIGKELAAEVAIAMQEQFTANLKSGLGLDGRRLPGITDDARRSREVAQGTRAGKADDRYSDSKFLSKVQKNYKRDYTASAKLGSFRPTDGPRGNLSGMLAVSFRAKPARKGGWIVFVAGKRSRPRPGESLSALESALGLMPGQTVPVVATSPKLQGLLKKVMSTAVMRGAAGAFKAATRLASIINRAGSAVGIDGGD